MKTSRRPNAGNVRCLALGLGSALLGLVLAPPAHSQEVQQAGVSAAVRGAVEVSRLPEAVGRQVASGEPIYLRDRIRSGADSGMQVLLLDETVFTIGPQSELVIDQFVYDPERSAGKVSATVAKGVFRFVTGRVANRNPDDMTVRTPAGTIGIRGTIVAGRVDGESAEVVLMGPGGENNASQRVGRFEFRNALGSVVVSRPGFGTTIGANEPPSPPIAFPPERIAALAAGLAPTPPGAPGGEGQGSGSGQGGQSANGEQNQGPGAPGAPAGRSGMAPGAFAGQAQAVGLVGLGNAGSILQQAGLIGQQGTEAAQAGQQIDRIATIQELNAIATGQFHFEQTVALASGGFYAITLDLDYGSRTIGGGNSEIAGLSGFGAISTFAFPLLVQSFDTGLAGQAQFQQHNIITNCSSGIGGCKADVDMKLIKVVGGDAGARLDHMLQIDNSPSANTHSDSGTGSTARQSGLAP